MFFFLQHRSVVRNQKVWSASTGPLNRFCGPIYDVSRYHQLTAPRTNSPPAPGLSKAGSEAAAKAARYDTRGGALAHSVRLTGNGTPLGRCRKWHVYLSKFKEFPIKNNELQLNNEFLSKLKKQYTILMTFYTNQ